MKMGKKKRGFETNSVNTTYSGTILQESPQGPNTLSKQSSSGENSGMHEWILFGVYGVFLLIVYVSTMYPTIMGGDSGELIATALELGVAHPPGYPLFTMLSWLTIQVIPVEDAAWKCNMLNALFSALAGLVFAVTIYRYTGSLGCALGGSSAWCFCKLTWTWAASAEVFGLNNLFTALLIYLLVVFQETPAPGQLRVACLGAFVSGLSLTNQHTLVLYVGIIALWVLLELHSHKLLNVWSLVKVGVSFSCGLIPYAYLPLSAHFSNGRWTWGDQRTLEGFMKHFLRQEYGTFDLANENTEDKFTLLSKLSSYGWHTMTEFSVVSLIFFLLGVKESLDRARRDKRRAEVILLVMMVVYLAFFSWRANLNMANPLLLGVVKRFWMQADCVFVLISSVGASYLEKLTKEKMSRGCSSKVIVGIGVTICAYQLQRNFTECNQRNSHVVEEFGLRILQNVPPNTLILTKGDLPSNVFRYLYLSRNHRPDVTVFDQEVLTYPWSVPMLAKAYPKIVFPGDRMERVTGYISDTGTRVFNSKTFLDVNMERSPIIACIGMQEHDLSWQAEYELFPFGPCSWIYKRGTSLDLDSLIKMADNMTEGWAYPYQGFDETSWDRVATDEMWNAKTNIGLHLYMVAVNMKEGSQARSSYLIKAYQIYKKAMDPLDPENVPSYWRKNFALVCEKMLSVKHNYSYVNLTKEAIHHFQKYVDLEPDDKDATAIRALIKHLKSQLKG